MTTTKVTQRRECIWHMLLLEAKAKRAAEQGLYEVASEVLSRALVLRGMLILSSSDVEV